MANVAKVACRYTTQGPTDGELVVEGAWTFHVMKLDSAPAWDATELFNLTQRVHLWWSDENPPVGGDWGPVRGEYAPDFRLEDITATRVAPTVSDPEVFTLPPETAPGKEAGRTTSFPQVAAIVSLRTSLDTRRGRGRIYLPPPFRSGAEFRRETGLVEEDEQLRWGGFIAHLAKRIGNEYVGFPDAFFLCVFSRVDNEARAVTHFLVPDRFATQRRRKIHPPNYLELGLTGEPA